MKVLFLDIDGVLNSDKWMYERNKNERYKFLPYPMCEFDPECVKRLNRILKETNAKLVVSSDWRFTKGLDSIFFAVDIESEIYDTTPLVFKGIRGQEIALWLKNHPEFTKYVILDDNAEFLKKQKPFLVRTQYAEGLTDELAEKAIQILND